MKTKLHLLTVLAILAGVHQVSAQGTAFTYQGRLNNGTNPASGNYNLTFSLYTASGGGSQVGGPVTNNGVIVTNGLFTVQIDFGAGVFTGQTDWLQVGVATNGAGSFTALTPRQQMTPTPYAIYAESANAAGLSGTVPPAQLPSNVVTNNESSVTLNNMTVSGNLTLNSADLWLLAGNSGNGLGYRTSVAGISPSGGLGTFVYGFDAGYLGTTSPDTVALSWDWHNNVTVYGEYFVVNGLSPVNAYIGDDGSGNDVQIGSQKSGVTNIGFYNTADNAYMHIYCSSITIEGGSDLAEPFKITSGQNDVPQGAVVVIDEQNPGHLKLSDQGYDTRVAGVISGANGINPGIKMQQQGLLEGGKNVALTGRVYVQADTSNGAIKPGDLLTTSSMPGHAMKVTDHVKAAGAILGKAMTGLSEGKGMVLVLVTLQ